MVNDPWLNNFTTGNAFNRRLVMDRATAQNIPDLLRRLVDDYLASQKRIAELEAQLDKLQKEKASVASYLETMTDRCVEDTKRVGQLEAQLLEGNKLNNDLCNEILSLKHELKTAKRDGILQMMVDLSRERCCFNDRHGIYTDLMHDYANSLTGEE